jgi:hypothetical protein
MKVVSYLWQLCGFLQVYRFPPPIKQMTHDTTEITVESGIKHQNPRPNPIVQAEYKALHIYLVKVYTYM